MASRNGRKIDSAAGGHYECLSLSFGIKNGPADFNRLMIQVLGNLCLVQIYFDDFYIAKDSFEKHLKHICIVIKKLSEANLKINLKKCNFFKKKLKILWLIVSKNCIMMVPEKFEIVKLNKTGRFRQKLSMCNSSLDYAVITVNSSRILQK